MQLNSNEIQAILPHRYPFLLIDRVVDGVPGEWARAIKCVSVNEQQFCGHFPQEHVMPGVLILEALAQVGAVAVLTAEGQQGKLVYFGGIRRARFRGKVIPGDQMELECHLIRRKGPVGIGSAVARVDGKVVADAELTFVIGS